MKKCMLKKALCVLLSTAMVAAMAGCGGKAAGGSAGSGTGAEASQSGVAEEGKLVLKQSLTEELNSLDPNYNYSATAVGMIGNVNEGLYKYGPDGNITLGLASDVQISEDGLTYTFTIRDDAYWSNGDPVTANDFWYSWRRLADPANSCTYAYMLITAGVKNAMNVIYGEGYTLDDLGVSCPDERTFVVELETPKPYFTELLATGIYFMPVNQKFCEECGDQFMLDKEHSIYCGAYVMTEWEVGGTTYTLEKNPTYYDVANVTCDTLKYTLLTDAQQQILSWESKDLDIVSLKGDYIAMYDNDPAKLVLGYPGLFFIAFNTENEYLSNKNLRLAISTAIDKKPIVDNILCDDSLVANYAIPGSFAKDSKGVYYRDNAGNPEFNVYDLMKAVQYWETAKSELGTKEVTLELLYNEDSSLASIAAYIQSQLQTNLPGLTVNLRCTSYNQRLTDMGNGNYEMGITRWYADYQDASTYLDMWIDGSNLNYENWSNAEYNELYGKVVGEYAMDEEQRIAAQMRMEEIVMGDAIICPLYQPSTVMLRRTNMEFVTTPTGIPINRYTRYKE